MNKSDLTEQDFIDAGERLGCDPKMIKAFTKVESSIFGPFQSNGKPTILFERHYFSKLTHRKYDGIRVPGLDYGVSLISDPTAGGYGKESIQYQKLDYACSLDRDAGLRSASWGLFQIMGDNCEECGLTIDEFVKLMNVSTENHLEIFCRFILHNKSLLLAIREKNFPKIAEIFNGKNYRKYIYDQKLKFYFEQ